jgi:hypothetical protein
MSVLDFLDHRADRLPSYAVDPIRQKIDEAIARALKLGDDFEVYRSLYAAKPLLSGHAPDSVGGNVMVG